MNRTWNGGLVDRGVWALRGAIVGAAIGAPVMVVFAVALSFPNVRNLDLGVARVVPFFLAGWPVAQGIPVGVVIRFLLPFLVGWPAAQGIPVGVAVRVFRFGIWQGMAVGCAAGFLSGTIFAFFMSAFGCDVTHDGCLIVAYGLTIVGAPFLLVAGIATGAAVGWMHMRYSRTS